METKHSFLKVGYNIFKEPFRGKGVQVHMTVSEYDRLRPQQEVLP